jgi:predicted acetyltransferase
MYKYRKMGIGTYVVKHIFEKFKGKWQVGYTPRNKIAKTFWNKVIKEYTGGRYQKIKNNVEVKYKDGTIGEVLVFEV